MAEYAAWDDAPARGPLWRFLSRLTGGDGAGRPVEAAEAAGRRGPRLGPAVHEAVGVMDAAQKDKVGFGAVGLVLYVLLVVGLGAEKH